MRMFLVLETRRATFKLKPMFKVQVCQEDDDNRGTNGANVVPGRRETRPKAYAARVSKTVRRPTTVVGYIVVGSRESRISTRPI